MAICRNDQIKNLISNRCVLINGTMGKKLIKQYLANEINLEESNVQKLKTLGIISNIPKVIVPNNIKESINKLKIKNNLPVPMKDKSKAFIEAWYKQKSNKYLNIGHEKYCKTKNSNDLIKPKVKFIMNIEFPIKRIESITPLGFKIESLNFKKQKFITQNINGISLEFNNYSLRNLLYKGISNDITYFEDIIDHDWLSSMNNYIYNLSTKDLYTLIGYTFYGDILANNYMRNKLDINAFNKDLLDLQKWIIYYPIFFQALEYIENITDINKIIKIGKKSNITIPKDNYTTIIIAKFGNQLNVIDIIKLLKNKSVPISEKYMLMYIISSYLSFTEFWEYIIQNYIKDLNNIIKKAPPLKKTLIVYRGVKNDYYLKVPSNPDNKSKHIYKTNSFVSTSVNLGSALRFTGKQCCFKRITLLPGTHTLLLAGISKFINEFEILLGSESMFYITKAKAFIPKITTDMCNEKNNQITVTDMVVIK